MDIVPDYVILGLAQLPSLCSQNKEVICKKKKSSKKQNQKFFVHIAIFASKRLSCKMYNSKTVRFLLLISCSEAERVDLQFLTKKILTTRIIDGQRRTNFFSKRRIFSKTAVPIINDYDVRENHQWIARCIIISRHLRTKFVSSKLNYRHRSYSVV